MLLLTFFFFTGYGRLKNPDYRIFIALLEETRLNNSEENKVCYIKYMIDLQRNQWQIYSNLIRVSLFNNYFDGILQRRLGLYDFSFHAWPVDYNWDETKAEYVLLLNIC